VTFQKEKSETTFLMSNPPKGGGGKSTKDVPPTVADKQVRRETESFALDNRGKTKKEENRDIEKKPKSYLREGEKEGRSLRFLGTGGPERNYD